MEGREDGKGKSVEEVRKWGKRRTDELRMEGKRWERKWRDGKDEKRNLTLRFKCIKS